jgi:hypothetical protein
MIPVMIPVMTPVMTQVMIPDTTQVLTTVAMVGIAVAIVVETAEIGDQYGGIN